MDEVESKFNYKTKIGILDYHSAVTNTARENFDAKALPTSGLTHNPLISLATALSQRVAED